MTNDTDRRKIRKTVSARACALRDNRFEPAGFALLTRLRLHDQLGHF